MTRARDTANALDTFRNRNLIINGAMQVAQRGTSSTSQSYKTVDRFFYSTTNLDNHAFTQTQQTVTDLAGFSNSWRITTTTAESAMAADELVYVAQKIEAQNLQQLGYGTSSAKNLTLSFYVKSSVTGTFATNIYQVDDNRVINAEYSINAANTWERKEITYAADQTGVIDNDNGPGFYVTWNLALGSNYKGNAATAWEAYNTDNWAGSGTYTDAVITTLNATWEITGVQLEVGEQATPFEHRSFGEELSLCQRYYEEWGGEDAYQPFGYFEGTGTVGYSVLQFTEKRDAPTVTVSDVAHFQATRAGVVFSAMTFSQPAPTHVFCTISRSSNNWTSGEIFSWRANASGSARIYFNAEL
jgi:hypothetical protein